MLYDLCVVLNLPLVCWFTGRSWDLSGEKCSEEASSHSSYTGTAMRVGLSPRVVLNQGSARVLWLNPFVRVFSDIQDWKHLERVTHRIVTPPDTPHTGPPPPSPQPTTQMHTPHVCASCTKSLTTPCFPKSLIMYNRSSLGPLRSRAHGRSPCPTS